MYMIVDICQQLHDVDFAASLSRDGVKLTSTRSSRADPTFAVSIIPGREDAILRKRA